MTSPSGPLHELAHAYGVSTSFTDWQGRDVEVPADSIRDVLSAIGVEASDPAAALEAQRTAVWRRLLPSYVVVREGEEGRLAARVHEGEEVEVTLQLESGGERTLEGRRDESERRDLDGATVTAARIAVPGDLPLGYHTLRARSGDRTAECTLIVTPRRLGPPAGKGDRQSWGFAAQLYSVRSRRSWGVGDLGDLADLAVWSGRDLGAGFVLINPLHAAEPVPPMEPSPYLPSSRRFFNPLYLRVEAVPEYSEVAADARAAIDALAADVHESLDRADVIDRDTSWTAKRAALELLHRSPRRAERDRAYTAYRQRHGEALRQFAAWSALAVEYGNDARTWPAPLQDPNSTVVADYVTMHEAEVDFEMWLQWLLDEQLERAQSAATGAGMPVGIMHDLAVGVHPGGADAWRLRDAYASGIEVGAPPDPYSQVGQKWGQPPWRPDRLAELAYAPLRDLIANVLRHAGGVRIDHIMGLFRLWWVPEGRPATEGAYVEYDHDAMIGVLVLEAHRAGAVVVGEDLGVVPSFAREYLRDRGILGTSILWFERDWEGNPISAEDWRELCLASVNTHDLPPTAGYLSGEHVRLRGWLGMLARPVEEEEAADEADRERWLDEIRRRGLLPDGAGIEETVMALHKYLALAPSRLLSVSLTDAVGDRRTQNQPGTKDEYPNWRVPLSGPDEKPILLEDVIRSPRAAALAGALGGPPRSAPHPLHGPPTLEEHEEIPPRPEEEIADLARATPDIADHARPAPKEADGAS